MLAVTPEQVAALGLDQKKELLALLELREKIQAESLIDLVFTDDGATAPDGSWFYPRKDYPKHVEFFEAGKDYRERCFLAANRVGKSFSGGFETTHHLTGEYPDWWNGFRIGRPGNVWVAGKTNETTRDIIQRVLLGKIVYDGKVKTFSGTGLIPKRHIGKVSWKQGVQDLADTVEVKHVSGGWSTLGFKSYQQGRGSFEGTAQDFIWLDEECPPEIYGECIIRTATTNGRLCLTFTPLEGITQVVLQFLPHLDPEKVAAKLGGNA